MDFPQGCILAMAVMGHFLPGKEEATHKNEEGKGLDEAQECEGGEGEGWWRGRHGPGAV